MARNPIRVPATDAHAALTDLEAHVRQLEQRTQELEQSLEEEYCTVLEEPVRFSLTNLRSKVIQLEKNHEESGDRLHLLASEYADLKRQEAVESVSASGSASLTDNFALEEVKALARELALERESRAESERKLFDALQRQRQAETKEAKFVAIVEENLDLHSRLSDQEAMLTDALTQAKESQQESGALRRANQELETDLQNAHDQQSFLEAKVQSLDHRIQRAESRARNVDTLQKQLDELQQKLTDANKANNVLRRAASKRNRELAETTEQCESLEEQAQTLRQELDAAHQQLLDLRADVQQAQSALDEAARERRHASELELANRALTVQLSEAKRTIIDAARLVGTVDELRIRLQQLGMKYSTTLEEGGRLRQENLVVRAELDTLIEAVEDRRELDPDDPGTDDLAKAVETIRAGLTQQFLKTDDPIQ